MTKVLVTGATGFVGFPTVKTLHAAGHDVVCAVRPGRARELADFDVELLELEDVFAQPPAWWTKNLAGVDMVIHLAWYAEPGKYLKSDKNMDCMSGTLSLAGGAVEAGVKRFVGVGTCFEYDLTSGNLSIETPLAPTTPYAAAKAATYTFLNAWFEEKETEFLWARLFYLYGEREDPRRLVAYLHQQLRAGKSVDLSDGTAIKDYMDVKDAAELLVRDAMSAPQGATNICSERGISIRELAEKIADEYGRRDLLNFGARPANLTDPPLVVGVRSR